MSSDEPHFVPNVPGSGMSRVILRAREYRPTHGFPRERWEQLAIPQLEAIAQEFRDRQRGLYRAAHDRAEALRAARETLRKAQEICNRLSGLLERR